MPPLIQCFSIIPRNLQSETEAEGDIKFKGHVLIAQDNKTNQTIISILLQGHGLSCDFADNL